MLYICDEGNKERRMFFKHEGKKEKEKNNVKNLKLWVLLEIEKKMNCIILIVLNQ